jgi:hypothetical protein
MRLLRALILALVPLFANALTVDIRLIAPPDAPAPRGTLTLRAVDGTTSTPTITTVSVPGKVELDVPAGTYVAQLQARGFWLAPQTLTFRDGASIDLNVRPTGVVSGRFSAADGDAAATVRFTDASDPSVTGETACASAEGAFRCELPAGKLDLRVSRKGRVPQYRWNVPVIAAKTQSLGAFVFPAGASMAGRIRSEGGELGDVQLSLKRVNAAAKNIIIKPGKGGFFADGPIPAGDYTLTAAQRGFVSAPLAVTIREGVEAYVREPIVLARPRRLSVLISPPVDPLALGWAVTLRETGARRAMPRVVADAPASLDGSWSADALLPGTYELLVRPKDGPVWRVEQVVVDDALTTKHVHVPSTRFEGTVTLGKQPIAAKLMFNGGHAESTITWRSDAEGRFHGYMPVPQEKTWTVTVQSELPPVDVTLNDVAMQINDSTKVARVDVKLPLTSISGLVVDERGEPVPDALVNVDGKTTPRMPQLRAQKDGTFDVNGLEPGTYRLTASAFLQESEVAEVALPEDEPVSVRLQVKAYRQWKGTIVTPEGRPVAGARIIAAAADVPVVIAHPARSDVAGTFVLLVPSAAKLFDFIVEPPGFAYHFYRAAFAEELKIVVEPNGGTLVVEFPDDRSVEPAVWHDGSVTSGYAFLSGWAGELSESAPGVRRLRVPQLDAGSYTVCVVPTGTVARATRDARCRSIELAPHGEASVVLTAR